MLKKKERKSKRKTTKLTEAHLVQHIFPLTNVQVYYGPKNKISYSNLLSLLIL